METTGSQLDHSKIWRDVGRMDEDQLNRYVGLAFQGEEDLSFLPRTFWRHYFELDVEHSDRGMPSPARFFAEMYIIIGRIKEGTYRVHGEAPDEIFRPRFETVINRLTGELLKQESEPTEKQLKLASSIAEAIERINTNEGPDGSGRRFGEVRRLRTDPRYANVEFFFADRIAAKDAIRQTPQK